MRIVSRLAVLGTTVATMPLLSERMVDEVEHGMVGIDAEGVRLHVSVPATAIRDVVLSPHVFGEECVCLDGDARTVALVHMVVSHLAETDGLRGTDEPCDEAASEVRSLLGVGYGSTDELVELIGQPTMLTSEAGHALLVASNETIHVVVRIVGLRLVGEVRVQDNPTGCGLSPTLANGDGSGDVGNTVLAALSCVMGEVGAGGVGHD